MAGQIPNVATSATTHSGLGFLPLDRSPSSPSSLASEQTTTRSSSTSLFSLSSPRSTLSSISDSSEQASPPSSTRASSLSDAILGPLGNFLASLWVVLFGLLQNVIIYLFAPNTDAITLEPSSNPLGRIAIIGAGITGISSAAHFLAHGFEVVIFEQSETIGGIWSRVNSTSSLQLDSLMYRFILPSNGQPIPCPKGRNLIRASKSWNNYRLSSRTRLNFTVEQVSRQEVPDGQPSKWTINNGVDGVFDGILVAVGTCGPAERVKLEGRERFQGKMVHSSELDQIDWPGKRVVVIGGGASAVEALELAVQSGCTTPAVLVTRTDKWFIPRNLIIWYTARHDPFVRLPITESRQTGQDQWNLPQGVEVQRFGLDQSEVVPADVIVEATGYKRPYLGFLPTQKLFRGEKTPGQYAPPNLFLQHFAANDWTCLMTNVGYYEGIGTVGHNHIGLSLTCTLSHSGEKTRLTGVSSCLFLPINAHVFTGILARMMMMFMLDDKTAPTSEYDAGALVGIPASTEMRSWVDRVVKSRDLSVLHAFSPIKLAPTNGNEHQ
ncbi:hypothetical protein H4Q26_011646 [Puccinia striiformis f. sp. tritici PST-130]|nr:hypothetical protein H4Q26_011646 [Puccinia striiformis f. sp. tritici PST-130]